MEFIIKQPATADDWRSYYRLRYDVLRKPWNQPVGSEKDELEEHACHFMAVDGEDAVGVCRIHCLEDGSAQVRFMAVDERYRGHGAGGALLYKAEEFARSAHCKRIILQARENAVEFYRAKGYALVEKTFLLYDSIQHYLMEKQLVD